MKQVIFYLLSVCFLVSCSSEPAIEKGVLPENLIVTKTKKHKRIIGTNLFAIIPDHFTYKKPFQYIKSEDAFLVISNNKIPFIKNERKLDLENLSHDINTILFKETTFNKQAAFLMETVEVDKNEHAYILNFGDDEYSTMILAQSKADQSESRFEMMEILKSIYIDNSIKFDPLETSFFTFDTSISKFKIAQTQGFDFRYTIDGNYDNSNKYVNSILVNEIGKTTKKQRTDLMNQWTTSYLKSNSVGKRKTWIENRIGNYEGLEFETAFDLDGTNGQVYFVLLTDDQNRTMKFTGIAFDDTEFHIKKYKETVQTIKFK